uniref:Uncharacterized protein n=1 Tax=Opuntia streptacantha TaxID=393608 RepID=A0A7C9E9K0_OPUST
MWDCLPPVKVNVHNFTIFYSFLDLIPQSLANKGRRNGDILDIIILSTPLFRSVHCNQGLNSIVCYKHSSGSALLRIPCLQGEITFSTIDKKEDGMTPGL